MFYAFSLFNTRKTFNCSHVNKWNISNRYKLLFILSYLYFIANAISVWKHNLTNHSILLESNTAFISYSFRMIASSTKSGSDASKYCCYWNVRSKRKRRNNSPCLTWNHIWCTTKKRTELRVRVDGVYKVVKEK